MIVAIEEGLHELDAALRAAGHQTVPLYGFNGPIDAVVYQNAAMNQIHLGAQNFTGSGRGILMVCARGVSANQVLSMLEHKSYSGQSLF